MKKQFLIDGTKFNFSYSEEVEIDFSLLKEEDGVIFYRVFFDWGKEVTPKRISLDYEIPAVNMYYMWDPINKIRDVSFGYRHTGSRLPDGMPLKSMVSVTGNNTYLLALSDVKTPVSLKMRGNQYSPTIPMGIDFFTMLCGPFTTYEAVIRVDKREIPFDQALYAARDWFDSLGYKNKYVPDAAKMPMYSTWYSYTQSISAEAALKECREAVKYGMDTIIVDDGWQTANYNSVYGNCGDWVPDENKFPDMKKFVDDIHAEGMKVMLWYATPFMGEFAKKCKDYEGKYLEYSRGFNCYYLDPRYKEIRKALVDEFSHAVRDWGFDGLKLDFIDCFKTNGQYNENMDVVSVEDATEILLSEVAEALRSINPEVLIEFRQPYHGPVVSTYGNMMRVCDCPIDPTSNRVQSLNLRIISGNCAVHSDMMYWNSADTPESVAAQLWGTMFAVPQISARMEEITPDQGKVLKNYLSFWTAHRDTLMNSRPRLTICENGYGSVIAEGNDESIAMLNYVKVYEVASDNFYVVNLNDKEEIIVKNKTGKSFSCTVLDCKGELVSEIEITDILTEIAVPVGGMLCGKATK